MQKSSRKESIKEEYAEIFARQTIGYLLRRSIAYMTRRLNDELQPYDITLNHWVVLSCLWQKDGLPVMYIRSQLQHVGGTLSDLLTRMEKRKLIKRKRDKKDRRVLRVYLTQEGSALSAVLPAVVHRVWHQAWRALSDSQLQQFSTLLDRMIATLEPDYSVCLPCEGGQVADKYKLILPPRSIGYRMKLLQLMIARRFTDAVSDYNVTSSHTLVLLRLWQDDGMRVTEIGHYLEQVGGTLTGVLERMEERQLIRREQDEKDKRSYRVWLMRDGEKLIEVIPPIAKRVLEYCCQDLLPEELEFMKQCLRQMLELATDY